MSRRKHALVPEADEPELDISSLIDVCFLLLIYFMVTATIQPRESDLPLILPGQSESTSKLEIQPMLIEIQDDGAILLNKQDRLDLGATGAKRQLPMLESQLTIYKSGVNAAGKEPLVQVSVGSETPQQAVVDVLNTLFGLEITKVTFTDFSNL